MIRPALPEDAEAIAALWNPYIRDSAVTFNSIEKTPEDVAALIAARPGFLVAEAEGALAGFASYDRFRGGIGYARTMEHTILLAPDRAGQGIGRALMAALEDHARAGQVHTLWAGVSAENPSGVAFHARIGFERVAVLAEVGWKFGRWMDLVLMRKGL